MANIEERALGGARGESLSPAELLSLRQELGRLKTRALAEIAQGDLLGNELLIGFLVQVNDVRDFLTRLLQERGESVQSAAENVDGLRTSVRHD